MRRFAPALLAALLTAGALAGCTASGGTAASSESGAASGAGSVDFQADTGRMPLADDAAQSEDQSAAVAAADRSVVTTGSLSLVAERPIAAAGRVRDIVEAAGGTVSSSREDPSGRASADLVLRIPSASFDRVLDDIEQQGDVRDVSIGAEDVTAQVTDYAVRIENLRTSIDRLQELLAEADTSNALVEIESALTDRQTSLEQLLAEQGALADRVSLATLSVSVVTPAAAPATGPTDFFAAVAAGAQGLANAAAATTIALGVALPWLVVLGAAGGAALLVRRAVRRRARPTSA